MAHGPNILIRHSYFDNAAVDAVFSLAASVQLPSPLRALFVLVSCSRIEIWKQSEEFRGQP